MRPTKGRRKALIDDAKLFAEIRSRAALEDAWGRVWRNGGAAGGDRVSVHDFLRRASVAIGVLANHLAEGHYRPGPTRAVDIPKRSGGTRRLMIPCVADRVVQTAVASALSPLFEEEFEDASFGYRPGRSVTQAVARIQALRSSGLTHVVDADVDDYFDNIPHDEMLKRLSETMTHGPLTELIALWIAHAAPAGRGLAQGSPLSPLLANLFLDRLDEAFSDKGARIVRFADDFVILTSTSRDAEAALAQTARLLGEHGLILNREKTRVTTFDRGFRFLGHMFVRSMVMKATPAGADEFNAERVLAEIARRDAAEETIAAEAEDELTSQEARGFSSGLRNLYVMQPGRRLSIRNQAFCVEEIEGIEDPLTGAAPEWREIIAVPHQRIDRIDLGPEARVTEQAIDHALATGTPLAFVDGHGTTRGMLAPVLAPRAGRHIAQARTALDETRRLELARLIVEGRLRNQRALLRKLLRERDLAPAAVSDAIARITGLVGRGDASRIRHAPTPAHAMGYEGAATASYWKAISALAHVDFRFEERVRRDNPEPANIGLNVFAWLLNRDITMAVLAAGLHPGFGALHGVSDQHDACVYDLMEEFRAHLIEGLFVYVTNRRILRPDMFTHESGRWRMVRGGGDALIRAYEKRAGGLTAWPRKTRRVTFRRVMIEQAHALARHHEKGETYRPFEADY
ncbi:MAG: CRISPR-associated endonuclease Cas1 [Candidatus Nanopelagicales bacterium]